MRIDRRSLVTKGFLSLFAAWLPPARSATRSFKNIAEFREIVMAAFRKRGGVGSVVVDRADPAKFRIKSGKSSVTADVTNIFGYINAYPDEDAGKIIDNFVTSLLDPSREVEDGHIVAVIRTKQYLDQMLADGLNVLHEPAGADLMTVYMVDRPDSMSPLTDKDIPGRDLASVRKIALDNVRLWLPKVVSNNELGAGTLYYVEGNTMLSTSLILLDDFWKSIAARFPGDVLIALPRKDQLFVFDDDGNAESRAGIRRLIEVTFEDNFNLLSGMLYARRGGNIVAVPD